jgi:murein L,D-transpeptidase YafK
MTAENIKFLEANYSKDKLAFWNSLKPAYDYFEKNHSTRKVLTDAKGHYSFKD